MYHIDEIDVVFIQIAQFETSPRLIKEYTALSKNFTCKMLLWNISKVPLNSNDYTYYFNFNPPKGMRRRLSFFKWLFFCFHHLSKLKPIAIHAVDLDGVMIALIYKLFHPKTVIVSDINDVTADRYVFKEKSTIRKLLLQWERFLNLKTNAIIVPVPLVIKQLDIDVNVFKGKVITVYNSQNLSSSRNVVKINLKDKIIRLIYVGMLHRNIRGLEMLINAAEQLDFIRLSIAGFGPDEQYFYQQKHLQNVNIFPRIEYKKIPKLLANHDMVVSLLDPSFQNYKYGLSSKIFDAFACAKPVITTEGTPSGDLVDKTGWGISIRYNENELINALSDIHEGKITFKLNPQNIKEYDWDNSSKSLLRLYEALLNK